MEPWHLVVDYNRHGAVLEEYLICPACWPTNTAETGQTPYGRTSVSTIAKALRADNECYHCGRHPEMPAEASV